MNKVFYVSLLLILFMGVQPAHAAVQNHPAGTWQVTGRGGSGAVGATVPVKFSITNVRDRCAGVKVRIKTIHEARQKLSLTEATVPLSHDVSPQQVSWQGIEFANGIAHHFEVGVRIDQGAVGDIIDDFEIFVNCSSGPGSIFLGTVDDISVNVIAKGAPSTPKKTGATSPARRLASISDLNSIFRSVHGRNPSISEWHYWARRLLDKSDRVAFKGAIAYHKQNGINH